MKAQFLHISLNFNGRVDADALKRKFNLALDWVHYMPNCWIVRTTSDPAKWYHRFEELLGDEDSLLIVKIDPEERAARLPDWVLQWMAQYKPKFRRIVEPTASESRV